MSNAKQNSILENIYTREQFKTSDNAATKKVDGVEYIEVVRVGTTRPIMIRKDSLRKVEKSIK